MKKLIVLTLALPLLVTVACRKKEEAGAGGTIGVAECDEYIQKYPACIAKMPEPAKPTAQQGFKLQVEAWKTAAATPEGKTALKAGCKATLGALASNPLCK